MTHFGFQYFARLYRDAVAVIDPQGTRWSRGALADLTNRIARALCARGLAPGDTIAIVAPNSAQFLAAYLAGIEAGLYVVPINWHLGDEEIAFMLADSGAKAVIAHVKLGPIRLAALAACTADTELRISIGGGAAGFTPLDELVLGQHAEPPSGRAPGRVMAYTSATTGRPKAVRLPLQGAEHALRKLVEWQLSLGVPLEHGYVHLCSSMLYHAAPLLGAVTALHMGHRVVLADRSDAESLLRLIERHGVANTFMVPAVFVRLLKLPREVRDRYSTASLRFVVHGGAPCPRDVKARMLEWWGPIIWESYGATEAQGTIASPGDWLAYPGTVGRPIPGSRIEILDERGERLPPGEIGLIYLSPHTGDRFEYLGDPHKTRMSRRGDLVTVGDLGYLNPQGYLFVCDRKSDLIISSGMNIYPAEIEQVLVQHPAVVDCAVIGIAHELCGEVPKAVVQASGDAAPGPELTADILSFLAARLSAQKMPKRIEYVEQIPRDPSGKLYRRLLRPEATHHAR